MKSKKTTFRLRLQKLSIAKVSHLYNLRGGEEPTTGKDTKENTVDSYPKTLPAKNNDVCQSTNPFVC